MLGATVAIAAAALLTAGCAPVNPFTLFDHPSSNHSETTMTPDQAKAALAQTFDDIEALVGGDWQALTDNSPRTCSLDAGGDGQRFNAFRSTTEPADRKAAIAAVKKHWDALGYSVSQRDDTETAVISRLFTTTPDGRQLQFTASDASMTLEGLTACVAAPADE
jgi:hypothetical protein